MKNAVEQEPEPKGKLDTVTVIPAADQAAISTDPVNGPEGTPLDWDAIDWQVQEEYGDCGRESSRHRRQGTSKGAATCRN